ncbi:MAG: inositol monophosphatase family protein [Candidatus Thorarchaeota archaeon]
MELLGLIKDAAEAAVRAVTTGLDHAADRTGTENPFGDKTLVIDKEAEAAVIEVIQSSSTPMRIMSEELGILEPEGRAEYIAIVDPIDGSANIERGIPLCSVGIALVPAVEKPFMHDVEMSVIKSFFTDETYVAISGRGVTKNGKRVTVAPEVTASGAIISYDTKKSWDPAFGNASHRTLGGVRDMRRTGSNLLDLCWTAAGSLDAMVDLRNMLPIVHVMGTHMVTEAGGVVIGQDGRPLDLPIDMRYRMSFVAASNQRLARELLGLFIGADR